MRAKRVRVSRVRVSRVRVRRVRAIATLAESRPVGNGREGSLQSRDRNRMPVVPRPVAIRRGTRKGLGDRTPKNRRPVSPARHRVPREVVDGRVERGRRRKGALPKARIPLSRRPNGKSRMSIMPAMPPTLPSAPSRRISMPAALEFLMNLAGHATRPGRSSSGGRRCRRWPAATIRSSGGMSRERSAVSVFGRTVPEAVGMFPLT